MKKELFILSEFLEAKGYYWLSDYLIKVDKTLMTDISQDQKIEILTETYNIGIKYFKLNDKRKDISNFELTRRVCNG